MNDAQIILQTALKDLQAYSNQTSNIASPVMSAEQQAQINLVNQQIADANAQQALAAQQAMEQQASMAAEAQQALILQQQAQAQAEQAAQLAAQQQAALAAQQAALAAQQAQLQAAANLNPMDPNLSALAGMGQPAAPSLTAFTGMVHTKDNATGDGYGALRTVGEKYTVVPDEMYAHAPLTLSQSQYNTLVAQVAGESGNSADDMLGVTTTVLNRITNSGYTKDVQQVLETGYFPWGRTYKAYSPGGKYYNTDWGQIKLASAKSVVDQALFAGTRNLNQDVMYYAGNGVYNKFSNHV